MALTLERQAERDQWREQVFRQALEIERMKLEVEQLRTQKSLPLTAPPTKDGES